MPYRSVQARRDEIDILHSWHQGKPSGPWELVLRPTDKCNLKCKPCWLRAFDGRMRYDDEMTKKEVLRVIDEAAELGVQTVEVIGGGEPMFDEDAAHEYLIAIKRHGMYGNLTTNGTRFTPKMIQHLVSTGWDKIIFSIDSHDRKTHDFIRGVPGCYDKTVKAIRSFQKEKERQGKTLPRIGIAVVMTEKLTDSIGTFLRFSHNLGAAEVNFTPMYVHAEVSKSLYPSAEQKIRMCREAEETLPIAEKLGIQSNLGSIAENTRVVEKSDDMLEVYHVSGSEHEARAERAHRDQNGTELDDEKQVQDSFLDTPCFQPWHTIVVGSDGTALPCKGSGQHYKKENIREKSLRDIWFSESFLRYRGWVRMGELPDYCRDCCGGIFLDNERIRENLMRVIEHV